MLLIWFLLSLLLIFLILIRIPKDNSGLAMASTSTPFFGPTPQIDIILNMIIIVGVLCYVLLAFKLNITV